jgi:probable rRNA maturation factor
MDENETEPPDDRDAAPGPDHQGPIAVEISDTQDHLRVDRRALTRLVRHVLAGEDVRRAAISVALVDDATIRALNRRHLDHDWPTDVISFALSDPGDPVLSGELVVSVEMAAASAREAGVDAWAEFSLYVVHGLLHLCGYDDRASADVAAMRQREDEVLAREGLPNTFLRARRAAAGRAERESVRWTD